MKSSDLLVREIVGRANEVPIMVNGEYVTALLDTGSMVSTMASSWCHSLGLQIRSLNNLLTVQSAGGHTIPYSARGDDRYERPDVSCAKHCLP